MWMTELDKFMEWRSEMERANDNNNNVNKYLAGNLIS